MHQWFFTELCRNASVKQGLLREAARFYVPSMNPDAAEIFHVCVYLCLEQTNYM